jgi:Anti-sigma-K factor rskA
VLALGVLGGVLGSGALREGGSRTVVARTAPPGSKVEMIVRDEGHSTLVARRLPSAGKGRVYQVWLLRGKTPQPTDALFETRSDGSASVDVPGSMKGVDAVLVTSEPSGGSRTPSRDPILSVVPS